MCSIDCQYMVVKYIMEFNHLLIIHNHVIVINTTITSLYMYILQDVNLEQRRRIYIELSFYSNKVPTETNTTQNVPKSQENCRKKKEKRTKAKIDTTNIHIH